MSEKYYDADYGRAEGREKNISSHNVFNFSDYQVLIRLNFITNIFYRRINYLSGEDDDYGKDNGYPFKSRKMKNKGEGDDENHSKGFEAKIPLLLPNSFKSIRSPAKAFYHMSHNFSVN